MPNFQWKAHSLSLIAALSVAGCAISYGPNSDVSSAIQSPNATQKSSVGRDYSGSVSGSSTGTNLDVQIPVRPTYAPGSTSPTGTAAPAVATPNGTSSASIQNATKSDEVFDRVPHSTNPAVDLCMAELKRTDGPQGNWGFDNLEISSSSPMQIITAGQEPKKFDPEQLAYSITFRASRYISGKEVLNTSSFYKCFVRYGKVLFFSPFIKTD